MMSKWQLAVIIFLSGLAVEYVLATYDMFSWAKNSGYFTVIALAAAIVAIALICITMEYSRGLEERGELLKLSRPDKLLLALIWILTAPVGKLIWVKANALDAATVALGVNELVFTAAVLFMWARRKLRAY